MSALCANASVSHLLPHYSSNLMHKGARVTLRGVTHGVLCLYYLLPDVPLTITALMPGLLRWTISPPLRSLILLKNNAGHARPWTPRAAGIIVKPVSMHVVRRSTRPRPLSFSLPRLSFFLSRWLSSLTIQMIFLLSFQCRGLTMEVRLIFLCHPLQVSVWI